MKVLFTFVLLVAFSSVAADPLFNDDFDDGNADGWVEICDPAGALFGVESGWYCFSHSTTSGGWAASINGDDELTTPHQVTVPDYMVRCQVMALAPTDYAGVFLRAQPPLMNEQSYILWLDYYSDLVHIFRHDAPGVYFILAQESFTLAYGDVYWIRFDCLGGVLSGKVWQGTLGDEPAGYLLQANDLNYTEPGCMGLVGSTQYSPYEIDVAFDNVYLDSWVGLDAKTWGGIKTVF